MEPIKCNNPVEFPIVLANLRAAVEKTMEAANRFYKRTIKSAFEEWDSDTYDQLMQDVDMLRSTMTKFEHDDNLLYEAFRVYVYHFDQDFYGILSQLTGTRTLLLDLKRSEELVVAAREKMKSTE